MSITFGIFHPEASSEWGGWVSLFLGMPGNLWGGQQAAPGQVTGLCTTRKHGGRKGASRLAQFWRNYSQLQVYWLCADAWKLYLTCVKVKCRAATSVKSVYCRAVIPGDVTILLYFIFCISVRHFAATTNEFCWEIVIRVLSGFF